MVSKADMVTSSDLGYSEPLASQVRWSLAEQFDMELRSLERASFLMGKADGAEVMQAATTMRALVARLEPKFTQRRGTRR